MTNTFRALARLGLVGLQVSLAVILAACGAGSSLVPARRDLAAKPLPPRAGGLDKADLAPDFALPDTQGRLVRLTDVLQDQQAVVLVFYHSRYCRLCLNLLADLEQHRLEFEQRRAQIVAVAYQSADEAVSTSIATGARYPILAAVDWRLAARYGVAPFLPGRVKGGNAPVSVFIIRQDGHVVWKFSTGSGTTWPSSEVILANLPIAAFDK
jgi:peroxiredoxin